jgi:hypothetical protein
MEFSQEELVEAIDRLVNGLLDRAGVTQPPVDVLAVAEEHLGIPVTRVDPVEEDERGRPRPRPRAARPAGAGIVLSPGMTEEQRQKAAADGIARTLMPEVLRKLGMVPGSETKPFIAHVRGLVVPRLLIPNRLLRPALKACRYDVAELHRAFRTAPIEMVALRLLDLDEACVIAVVDDGVVSLRRANRFAAGKKLEPAEQACLDRVMKLDVPQRLRDGEWVVAGWPVPNRPFRRILLRAVHDDV